MRHLTMLGLAAVTALAATALLGAGSASATVLCTENVRPCPKGEDYAANTEIHATLEPGVHSVLKDTAGNIIKTCTGSTFKGKTLNTGGGEGVAVVGAIEALTFTGCTSPTVVIEKGLFEIHYVKGTNTRGTMTLVGTKITTNAFGSSCVYGGIPIDTGTVTGKTATSNATIHVAASLPKVEGGIACPLSVVWEAGYLVTAPVNFYIKEESE
jgi:hypothetical protein